MRSHRERRRKNPVPSAAPETQKKVGPLLKKRCTVGSVHEHYSTKWLNLTMTSVQAPYAALWYPAAREIMTVARMAKNTTSKNKNKDVFKQLGCCSCLCIQNKIDWTSR